jgi:hypothetical protein
MQILRWTGVASALGLLLACASHPAAPPAVPASLRVPEGQSLFLTAEASGVQIYQCVQKADGGFEWLFKSPEATLTSPEGKPLGKHYAGPTWEANDGSTVVGALKERDPGPTPSAIPWLLLTAKTTTGSGTFSATKSIQRLATAGGVAPHDPCAAGNLNQMARVPYTARYYFYR